VHVRTTALIGAAIAFSWLACRKPSAPSPVPITSPLIVEAPKAQTAPTLADPLCYDRPLCFVADRRPVADFESVSVVTVRLAAPKDAATDEDRCERREYWLARPQGNLLLAVDCETQWGADNAGPASLSMSGNLVTFRYVEFLSDDACETVEAIVRLPEGRVEAHTRHLGRVVGKQCRASRKVLPPPAPGSGARDTPVVVLHRP
jgi:hypothetical protein